MVESRTRDHPNRVMGSIKRLLACRKPSVQLKNESSPNLSSWLAHDTWPRGESNEGGRGTESTSERDGDREDGWVTRGREGGGRGRWDEEGDKYRLKDRARCCMCKGLYRCSAFKKTCRQLSLLIFYAQPRNRPLKALTNQEKESGGERTTGPTMRERGWD